MDNTRLYLVPTPIGNLGDITIRAIDVLKKVDVIFAEDTRTSSVLLKHYDINTPMRSFHMHNEHKKVDKVIEELEGGTTMALISDAGTPGISDPGFLLTRAAVKQDIKMEALPGATAFVPALVKSGFPTDRFVFEGFLPQKKGRQTRLKLLAEELRTIVLYESPHRLLKALKELSEVMAERSVSVSRELTKKFEETRTGTVVEVLSYFESKPSIKGEIVIVINAKK